MPELPDFVPPMLARSGRPFDSDEHVFEVKWDGTRTLAFVEPGELRLRNRRRRDSLIRYPELDVLASLPPGTVLDGEVVILRDGKPDFRGMLEREQARTRHRALELARSLPATFVAFDLLYRRFDSCMRRPLRERQDALREVVGEPSDARLVVSDGVLGEGLNFFEEIGKLGLEGMVAKRLASIYQPGRRTDAWVKIKQVRRLLCAILGYLADERGEVRSLIVGADDDGALRCVGRVGSGIDEATRGHLRELLSARKRDSPLIECGMEGEWVEPGLYCAVSYLERTSTGFLRAPVFLELIE